MFLPEDLITKILFFYNKNIICKIKNYSLSNKLNLTCKTLLNENKKYNTCKIISFENKFYCSQHNHLEFNICKYLINIRKNRTIFKLQNYPILSKESYSYHLGDDEDFDKRDKLEGIFKNITDGTEFIFSHCCCNKKGIMFFIN